MSATAGRSLMDLVDLERDIGAQADNRRIGDRLVRVIGHWRLASRIDR